MSIALKNGIIIILIILVLHHLLNMSLKNDKEKEKEGFEHQHSTTQLGPEQPSQQQVKDELFEFLFKGGMQEAPMPMQQQQPPFSSGLFDSSSANKMFSNLDGFDGATGSSWAPV